MPDRAVGQTEYSVSWSFEKLEKTMKSMCPLQNAMPAEHLICSYMRSRGSALVDLCPPWSAYINFTLNLDIARREHATLLNEIRPDRS